MFWTDVYENKNSSHQFFDYYVNLHTSYLLVQKEAPQD